ncbi:E3 ubiquitin-protein ligase TRIM41-like isoform X1 [Xyrauchen texanus]|uniref:E3 ubiquitin-protein ligase TRIM41-like isoform X1 n=1 Tax=Xyrauchen texanus TaxID=154827 RepID=UPI00224254BB|nr:E3 ubiquitin-protein ligase TRIM41-like isoform X1 [Xyrauchen texanus]
MSSISLDEELICAVCRDIFSEPVTLPCGHNYCEQCVNKLKRSLRESEDDEDEERVLTRYYTCPLCLSPCDSRVELKKNTVLNNIIEKYHSKRDTGIECSVCKGEQKLTAEKMCVNCEEYYCTLHVMPHLENNTLRQHVLVNPVANSSRLCKEHGKELELFCRTDGTALCVYCMLPSEAKHLQGHNVVKLSDSLDTFKEDCRVKLDNIKANLSEVQAGLSKLEENSSTTKEGLENEQRECTVVLNRIRLFLDFEEKAQQKRFSVDLMQDGRSMRQKAERLDRLRSRLLQAQEALIQARSFHDPLIVLQTIKNTDWTDLFDKQACANQISEAIEWNNAKPTAMSKISSMFQTIRKTFAGDNIVLNPASAHHRLKLNPERNTVWLTENGGLCSEELYCVMGEASFSCGVHHWEVDVASVHSWAVGVSYSCQQGSGLFCALGRNDLSWSLHYSRNRRQFCAQHDWLQFSFSDSVTGLPTRVGVFLDVETGFLSFYDAIRMKHLYTFYCNLQAPVYPAFCLSVENTTEAFQRMRVINPMSDRRLI